MPLSGIGCDHLLASNRDGWSTERFAQPVGHQLFQGLMVEVELQMPAVDLLHQFVTDQFPYELRDNQRAILLRSPLSV